MAAQRKPVQSDVPDARAAAKSRPRLAGDSDAGGFNPVLAAQRLQLETLLAEDEPALTRYSGAVRLAVIVGGSAALWVGVAAGVARLLAAL